MEERLKCCRNAVLKSGEFLRRNAHAIRNPRIFAHDVKLPQDIESERIILSAVERLFPGDGYLSEERGSKPSRSGYRWILDPLDGTMNYYRGIPHCCVSVACLRGETPLFGLVYDFFRKELFSAQAGSGAFLNGRRVRVSGTARLADAVAGFGFMKGGSEIRRGLTILGDLVGRVKKIRLLGAAALDFCYVSCGRLDLFLEYGLHDWDVAAGALILEEAGGTLVTRGRGRRRTFLATNGLVTPGI